MVVEFECERESSCSASVGIGLAGDEGNCENVLIGMRTVKPISPNDFVVQQQVVVVVK